MTHGISRFHDRAAENGKRNNSYTKDDRTSLPAQPSLDGRKPDKSPHAETPQSDGAVVRVRLKRKVPKHTVVTKGARDPRGEEIAGQVGELCRRLMVQSKERARQDEACDRDIVSMIEEFRKILKEGAEPADEELKTKENFSEAVAAQTVEGSKEPIGQVDLPQPKSIEVFA